MTNIQRLLNLVIGFLSLVISYGGWERRLRGVWI